jgi:hypothetical protein
MRAAKQVSEGDIPIWRTGAFAGEFGDAFIKDTNLEGGSCSDALKLLLPIIESCLHEENDVDPSCFTGSDVSKLLGIVNDLRHAIEIQDCIEHSAKDPGMNAFLTLLKTIPSEIKKLAANSRIIIPGGWATPSGGHAILYVVECYAPGKFAFCVCNTGNGISYHPSINVDYPKTKYKTAMRFGEIPLQRISSVEFWYMLLNLMVSRSVHHRPEVVYEVLLPFLAGGSFHSLVERELEECGEWESPQLSGTCYYRCILTALRYLMKKDGFSRQQQKILFVKIRLGYLEIVERQLRVPQFVQGVNFSDSYIIKLACCQTGSAAVKLFNNGQEGFINPQLLRDLELLSSEIRTRLGDIRRCSDLNSSAVRILSKDASLQPFDGFELVMDDSDRSTKRGSTALGSASLYVNLMFPFPSSTSLYKMCLLFQWAADRCDEIRTKSNLAAASVAFNQICSFLEYIFVSHVQFPGPIKTAVDTFELGADNSPLDCTVLNAWDDVTEMTKEIQHDALIDLGRLSVHYLSAAKSLGTQDRAATAIKSITTAAMFITFEALIRLCLPADPLFISVLLRQYGCVTSCAINGGVSFSTATESWLLTRPECCIARFHIVRYLESAAQLSDRLLFDYTFEAGNEFSVGLAEDSVTLTFVRDLQHSANCYGTEVPTTSARRGRAIQTRVAQLNETEMLFAWYASSWNDVCPEFARYRDMNIIFRLMMQPEFMFNGGSPQQEIWSTQDAQPEYDFISTSHDRKAVLFGVILAGTNVAPTCKVPQRGPLFDALEGISANQELTEAMMLCNDSLPDFDHTLSAQESEHFFTLCLHPFIAGPLMLHFFAGDRIALLVNSKIQGLLESLIFEPRTINCSAVEAAEMADTRLVPVKSRNQLKTNFGVLYDEMKYSPLTVLSPLVLLLESAISITISGYKSTVAGLLLFLVRLRVRIELMLLHCLGAGHSPSPPGPVLPSEIFRLQYLLNSVVTKRIDDWISEALQEREIEYAVKLHAHAALISATALDIALCDKKQDWLSNVENNPFIKRYLCACAYVTCWNGNKANGSNEKTSPNMSGNRFRSRRPDLKNSSDLKDGPVDVSPISAVFYCIQRLRPTINRWIDNAPRSELNSVLDAVASVGLQHPFKETNGWNNVADVPLMCSLTVGNEMHPYLPCTDWSQTISFPGAASINVFFDPRSATERTNDYVVISYPGCLLKFDGPAGSLWPGSNGSPALSIPYDTFVIEFHSDRSGGDWGFQFTAVAPICSLSAQRLVERTQCSMLRAQLALKECRNYEELAYQYILEYTAELALAENHEIHKRSGIHKTGNISVGLFQDCFGYVQINLQTCEVYVNNRMNMPVPTEIAGHPDFKIHFGKYRNLLCTVSSTDTNRQCIEIIDPDGRFGAYEVQAWTPLKPYGRKGSGLGAILYDDSDNLVDDGRCTAFNMPVPVNNNFQFGGHRFVRYCEGRCGWVSAIFDRLSFLSDDDFIGAWCSESCLTMSSAETHDPADQEFAGKMLVQMQCSPGGRDLSDIEGHPGAWFEVWAVPSERLLMIFALIDEGRKIQRSLVYSSSLRLALRTLEPCTEFTETPKHHLLQSEGGHICGGFKDHQGRIIPRPGVGPNLHASVFSLTVRRSRLEIPKLVTGHASTAHEIFCTVSGPVDTSSEEWTLEEFISPRCLFGLIPEYLLEQYQFWRTGNRLIRGYRYSTVSRSSAFERDSVIVVVDRSSSTATIHQLSDGKREMTLLNPLLCCTSSLDKSMRSLVQILTEVELLSHILFWTTSEIPFVGCEVCDPSRRVCEISRIEFPRLKTAFDMRMRNGEAELSLSDHDDLVLCLDVPESVKRLYSNFARCIPLRNSTNQYFLLVPTFGLIQPMVKACPFTTDIVYDRSFNWYSKVQSRYYLYPVHPSSKFLEMPTVSAALYWILLCFVHRKYWMVATLVNTVFQTDLKLNEEQRYFLAQIPKTSQGSFKNVDSHPDAHACRLMIALVCLECGEKIDTVEWRNFFWDVGEDIKAYLGKYAHVSQVCRLNIAEEKEILAMFPNVDRKRYLDTLERVLTNGTDSSIPSAGHPATFGEDPVIKQAAKLKKDLESWRASLSTVSKDITGGRSSYAQKGNLFYRRPADKDLTGSSAIITLSSLWRCFEHQRSVAGSLSYLGFAFLYELLSGQTILQFLDEDGPQATVSERRSVVSENIQPRSSTTKKKEKSFTDKYSKEVAQLQSMGLCPDWDTEEVGALLDIHNGRVEPAMISYMEDPETAKLSVVKLMSTSIYSTGKRVECNYKGYGMWYAGVIVSDCNDKYDVAFDDGDFETNVDKGMLRVVDPLHDENTVKMLRSTGIVKELSVNEMLAFVAINKGRDPNDVAADYLNSPVACKIKIDEYIQSELDKEEMLRQEKMAPRRYPCNWVLVKFIAQTMLIVDVGGNNRHLAVLLLCTKFIESVRPGVLPMLPLFPYLANTKELDSQQGLASTGCSHFYKSVIDKCLQLVNNIIHFKPEIEKPAAFSSVIEVRKRDYLVRPTLASSRCCRRPLCLPSPQLTFSDCDASAVQTLNLSVEDLTAFSTMPMSVLPSFHHIAYKSDEGVSYATELPFDITAHAAYRKCPTAVALVQRTQEDLKQSSIKLVNQKFPYLSFLGHDVVVDNLNSGEALKKLLAVKSELLDCMNKDSDAVISGIHLVEQFLKVGDGDDSLEHRLFRLQLTSGHRCQISFEMFAASLSSDIQLHELHAMNPFLSERLCEDLNALTIVLLMLFVRSRQTASCVDKINKLISAAADFTDEARKMSSLPTIMHQATELALEMTKKRYCVFKDAISQEKYVDPRYLLFEFITGFLLRKRQVELIQDFTVAHKNGQSSVHQMIMGAGKTQIISPILSLMLADGNKLVTLVCPGPLLPQSRIQLRARFSNVLPKRILTLTFDRCAPECNNLDWLHRLEIKLEVARRSGAIVLTTPQSVKSLFLKYIDLLQQVRNAPDVFRLPPRSMDAMLKNKLKSRAAVLTEALKMADSLRRVLGIWADGVALLDEVDLLLHPLKSELNFPIGEIEVLPMLPQRFELPMHLLDLFYSRKNKRIGAIESIIWDNIHELVEDGKKSFMFQSIPHLILLSDSYFLNELRFPLTQWAVRWIALQQFVRDDIQKVIQTDNYSISEDQVLAYIEQYIYCEPEHNHHRIASMFIEFHFVSISVQLFNLAKQWIWMYLPHVLSKIHRVSFGLIGAEDIQRWKDQEIESAGGDYNAANNVVVSKSRRLLAVPFVGKDVPSRSSEFANPEVQIGLTIVAYRLHGLHPRSAKELITELKRSFLMEPGPFSDRPSRILLEEWKLDALVDSTSVEGSFRSASTDILPLEILQTADENQMQIISNVLKTERSVIAYYLNKFVFPNVLKYKATKLQANGNDLGGEMIFGSRYGFSGTPSDLLPLEIRPCHYEPGSEAAIIRTLSDPTILAAPEALQIGNNWNVDVLLEQVASGNYSALIDSGALITGYTPEQVARKLLQYQNPQKAQRKDVCVFLDERDLKMVVDTTDGPAYELDRCGVVLEKRMAFYDHVHTTGIDIKHSVDATAVCTLGKDLTLRDYAQGCWRMRGLGQGQRVHVLVIEEIRNLVQGIQKTNNVLSDILAWLMVNSAISEKLQHVQLESQLLADKLRQAAFRKLTHSAHIPIAPPNEMLVPSKFFGPCQTDDEAEELLSKSVIASQMNSLLTEERKLRKSNHTGMYRSKNVIQTEIRWCDIEFLRGGKEVSCTDCVHYCDDFNVITSSHWSCCGDRNRDSTDCLDFDPAAIMDFTSVHIASDEHVSTFYQMLLKLLPGYNGPGQLNRGLFLEALTNLAQLEQSNPTIWAKISGSLFPPYTAVNMSTLLVENDMLAYAMARFNSDAVRVIEKLTIAVDRMHADSELPPNTTADITDEFVEADRAAVRSAIDIFMEPIHVHISDTVIPTRQENCGRDQESIVSPESAKEYILRPVNTALMLTGPHKENLHDMEVHYSDREIVQEQEKERDEEREMEIFRAIHPGGGHDIQTGKRWSVDDLFRGRVLMDKEGEQAFYPLSEFCLNQLPTSKLPFPHFMYASEGYAPFIHASGGKRRLKNVTVLLQWIPCDDDKTLENCSPVSVIISLAEAESLRFLINRDPSLQKIMMLWSIDPPIYGSPVSPPLLVSTKGICIDRRTHPTYDYAPSSLSDNLKDLNAAVQFARYFNSSMYFDDAGIVTLLTMLEKLDKTHRRKLFTENLDCRLRDLVVTANTPVEHIFRHDHADTVGRILHIICRIRELLVEEFEDLDRSFTYFAGGQKTEISPSELKSGLARLRTPYVLSDGDAAAVTAYVASMSAGVETPVHRGPTISKSNYFRLHVPIATRNRLSAVLLKAPEGLTNPDEIQSTNIFQGHSQPNRGVRNINEFFSHLHTPNIQSIGQIVVISTPSSVASGQSSRVHISNDSCISTDSTQLLTVAPRGVKLSHSEGGVWCFEVMVITAGTCLIGFTDADQVSNQARHPSPIVCGVSNARVVPFSKLGKGDVIRFHIDMYDSKIAITYCHYNCRDHLWSEVPIPAFTTADFVSCSALFPFVSFDKTFKFRLNLGNLPFCSALGNMPAGGHSLSHWIRTRQEREYVRNRHSLGGYGNLSNVSGRFHLEIVKLEQDHQWEMRMASKENKMGSTMWETAFPTVFVDGVLLTQGKWYYEVTIRTNNVASQFGWADLDFIASNDSGQGVGDEKHSWAYDGDRKCLWHNRHISYGEYWKVGDVLGCACDLDIGCKTISFSLNGHWFSPTAFTGIQYSVGLMPALTTQARLSSISYHVNFSRNWKFRPPSEGHSPICDWIEYGKQFLCSESAMGEVGELVLDTVSPSAPLKMFRQVSAQPYHSDYADLGYVPVVIRCGNEQIAVVHPLSKSRESHSTMVTTVRAVGDDSSYPSIVADCVSLTSGKWCFEVSLRSTTAAAKCSFGFAEKNWVEGHWSEMSKCNQRMWPLWACKFCC